MIDLAGLASVALLAFLVLFLLILLPLLSALLWAPSRTMAEILPLSVLAGMLLLIASVLLLSTLGALSPPSLLVLYACLLFLGPLAIRARSILRQRTAPASLVSRLVERWRRFWSSLASRAFGQKALFFSIMVTLAVVLVAAAYSRMGYSLDNYPLPSIDPYGHLLVSKMAGGGQPFAVLGFYDDYPRGYHSLVVALNLLGGLSFYDIQRYLGGVLGFFSVFSLLLFVSRVRGITCGIIASLLFSGFLITPEMSFVLNRHAQSVPETFGIMLLPLFLMVCWNTRETLQRSRAGSGETLNVLRKAGLPPMIGLITLYLIHPYTALLGLYALLILLAILVLVERRLVLMFPGLLAILTFLALSEPHVAAALHLYPGGAGESLSAAVSIASRPYVSVSLVAVPLLSLLSIPLSIHQLRRKEGRALTLLWPAICCIVMATSISTGLLLPSRFSVERALPIFAMFSSVFLAVFLKEALSHVRRSQAKRWSGSSTIRKHGEPVVLLTLSLTFILLVPPVIPKIESFGYDDNVYAMKVILDRYDISAIRVYSEKVYLVSKERALVEPGGEHRELSTLVGENASIFEFPKGQNFVFVEKESFFLRAFWNPDSVSTETAARTWMEAYASYHANAEVFFETGPIVVWRIGRA